jgi:hypothetical protein
MLANYRKVIEWVKKRKPERGDILEIGCLGGDGTRLLANEFPDRTIVVVDPFDIQADKTPGMEELYQKELKGRDQIEVFSENISNAKATIKIVPMDSRDWTPSEEFFLAIVDGGHSADCIENDLRKLWAITRYIAVHDYGTMPDVTKVVDQYIEALKPKTTRIDDFIILEF